MSHVQGRLYIGSGQLGELLLCRLSVHVRVSTPRDINNLKSYSGSFVNKRGWVAIKTEVDLE